jgi:hypothetical protein
MAISCLGVPDRLDALPIVRRLSISRREELAPQMMRR